MTQEKKNGKIIAIITMIFLFGMISFVTNLAAPMGIVLKNQFDVSNALGMLGNFGNFIAYAVMGIPSGILLQRVGYKKIALIAVAIGFCRRRYPVLIRPFKPGNGFRRLFDRCIRCRFLYVFAQHCSKPDVEQTGW